MNDTARDLVRQAFERARASGKRDWTRMTVAVLKNRLLDITNGEFTEREFGAKSITEFASTLTDLVDVDKDEYPPVVVLKSSEAGAPTLTGRPERERIRSDVWRALMDFSSGSRYYWDAESGRAEVAEEGDEPILPTVQPEELQEWMHEFVEGIRAQLDDASLERAERWAREILPNSFLAPARRGEWNGFIRAKLVERIQGWFSQEGLEEPADLVVREPVASPDERARSEWLRQGLLDVIGRMTDAELAQISIPATAVARLFRRKK